MPKGRGSATRTQTPQQKAAATRRRNAEAKRQAEAGPPRSEAPAVNGVLVQRVEGPDGSVDILVAPLGDVKQTEVPTILRRAANDSEKRLIGD